MALPLNRVVFIFSCWVSDLDIIDHAFTTIAVSLKFFFVRVDLKFQFNRSLYALKKYKDFRKIQLLISCSHISCG